MSEVWISQLRSSQRRSKPTDLTYFVHAAVSLPHAGNKEANHDEAEDQQGRHDQTQESHVARTEADVRGRWDGHGCRDELGANQHNNNVTQ